MIRGIEYEGPRGTVRVDDSGSRMDVYMARADGYDFDVMDTLV